MIFKHLDKNNLHHAYLLEGEREEITKETMDFLVEIGVPTSDNADFSHIAVDSFKIEDARNLKAFALERGVSTNKKVFLVSANNFLLEAQNALLKVFEEPIENTHFFIIVPDASALLKTFLSRFFLISPKTVFGEENPEIEKFLKMPLKNKLDVVKELVAKQDLPAQAGDIEDEEVVDLNSARAKSLKFLNALEFTLHNKLVSRGILDTSVFKHIFKVREFLRMPGSSVKTLMESVVLVLPVL